jgi:hypothetical protein
MRQSTATLVYCLPDFLIRERRESLALRDLLAKCAKIFDSSANLVKGPASLRYDPSHRFVVSCDNDLLATRDAIQEFSETGFRFQGGDSAHRDCLLLPK